MVLYYNKDTDFKILSHTQKHKPFDFFNVFIFCFQTLKLVDIFILTN